MSPKSPLGLALWGAMFSGLLNMPQGYAAETETSPIVTRTLAGESAR